MVYLLIVGLVIALVFNYMDNLALRGLVADDITQRWETEDDIRTLYKNQEQLDNNQKDIDAMVQEINIKQSLAEKFFDSMIIELILENDLNVNGQAYQQHLNDINIFQQAGIDYWSD